MRFIAFALAVIATFTSFGINHADSVKVYFRTGLRQFDPSLADNRQKMDSFINRVREAASIDDIDYVVVRAYASPDGQSKANEILAVNRCNTISDYIIEKTGINGSLIKKMPEGVAWDGLKELVEKTPEVPSRDAVLDILNNTPIWIFDKEGNIIGGRKSKLMSLDRGIPYRWMLQHLFPELRNAVAVTMMTKGIADSATEPKEPEVELEEREVIVKEKIESVETPELSETPDSSGSTEHTEPGLSETSESDVSKQVIQRFALKTNILYYAALMPNLEFEWLMNDNWSIGVEGDVAWWKKDFSHIYRLAIISPEVRYHIRPKAPWHGMYVGLFLGGGWYQLENGGDGYKGEGGMGGVSFGYIWPIGKYFSLEAGLGAGYMHTRYRVYHNRDDHKLYMRTKSLDYFGPLKLKFSIVWRFGNMNKTVKVNSTL